MSMQGTPRVDELIASHPGIDNDEDWPHIVVDPLIALARQLERELAAFKRGPNGDKLHVEPTPVGWVAYYDPEGLNGHGKTQQEAITELLDQTDEAWRTAWDGRAKLRRELVEAREVNPVQDRVYDGSIEKALDARYQWGGDCHPGMETFATVTRFEVIDNTGRAYVRWDENCIYSLSLQDQGRTLKALITPKPTPGVPDIPREGESK